MARRFLIALVAALLISTTAVIIISKKLANNKPVVQVPFQYVAVAHAVDPGDILKKEDLILINWPRTNPLTGPFSSIDAVVGRVVLYPLAANQPVLDQELASGSGLGVTGRIPSGMRAIALRSDEVIGVAGFLMPATHVDVLVTYRPEANQDPVTATVLQDAEVLAVGHELQPDPSGKPQNVDVVTLLLTPEDAEKAVLATAQGTIHFVLRSGQDNAAAQTIPVTLPELASLPSTKRGAAIPVHKIKPVAPKPWVVETQLGAARSKDSFSY
jgi:pilus assembly protein CpaB